MSLMTFWTVRCSFEGCRAKFAALARTPSEFSLLAESEGWTFPYRETGYAYAAVYASGERAHCAEHGADHKWDAWSDEKARYEASCMTCMEDYKGTRETCEEWAKDHRCEPNTAVRKIST